MLQLYPLDALGQPALRESFVLFMDILGFKDLASGPQASANLVAVWNALQKHVSKLGLKTAAKSPPPLYAIRGFTDNIVVGFPIHADGEDEFGYIVMRAAEYQLALTLEGFFVRGGLAVGPLFMDDLLVFGEGLNEAYEHESKIAVSPRIVLTSTAEKLCVAHTGYYAQPASAPQNKDLLRDPDGSVFINYLEAAMPDDDPAVVAGFRPAYLKHKAIIQQRLTAYVGKTRIWEKYAWAGRYHNFVASRVFPNDQQLQISGQRLPLGPGPFVP